MLGQEKLTDAVQDTVDAGVLYEYTKAGLVKVL